jgi:anti-sigma factor RsiW
MSHGEKTTPQERFELLSAYVDNEVTDAEKSQVEKWLKADLNYRTQYHQLLKVKRLLLDLPTPTSIKTEQLVNRVITKINRRSQRKFAMGGAIAALVIGTFATVAHTNYRFQVAEDPNREEQLILAMEEPIVPLPEALIRK